MDITKAIKEAKSDQEKRDLLKKHMYERIDYTALSAHDLMLAVKAGHCLWWIPKRVQTYELCETAIAVNGENLRGVSKRFITKELCYKAVETSKFAIKYAPKELMDSDLLKYALCKHGDALLWLENKQKTLELCQIAVKSDGLALQYVPSIHKNYDLFLTAVQSNGLALKYVPEDCIDEKLCTEAVKQNPFALQFVPDGFKHESICLTAINANGAALAYAPLCYYTKERIINAFRSQLEDKKLPEKTRNGNREKYLNAIFMSIPDILKNDYDIVLLERQLGLRTVTRKYYSASDSLFYVIEGRIKTQFSDFDSFYHFLGGDTKGADLRQFCFDVVDPLAYSFEGAILKPSDEQRLIPSNNRLQLEIKERINAGTFSQTKTNEIIKPESVLRELSTTSYEDNNRRVFYVSDIHLTHKIAKKASKYSSDVRIEQYIDSKVKQLVNSATNRNHSDYLLIAGDVSFDYRISELFYRALAKHWSPYHYRIVVVLGNHELWDYSVSDSSEKLESVVTKYRELFSELKIVFLQNELFIERNTFKRERLSYETIMKARPVDLEDLCWDSSLIVLGGIGFSGYNQDFNASHNIYQSTIRSYEEELKQTQMFEKLYEHVDAALWDRTVIVLTHMPKDDWSKGEYNPNWIYVSGHTHFNDFYCGQEKTYFADNQIGYYNTKLSLKWFYTKKVLGAFDFYQDGTYPISSDEYVDFMHARLILMNYNRSDGQIIMLKRTGFYCFLLKKKDGGLFLLNGGQEKKLKNDDVSYYYDVMALYGTFVQEHFSAYYDSLKTISSAIQRLGGSGNIHGAIVDVDFFNHVYLNPVDGTLTCYTATSMSDKFVHNNVLSFLKAARPDMYNKYLAMTNQDADGEARSMAFADGSANSEFGILVSDTSIYGPSRKLRGYQYLLENGIIRVWDEAVVEMLREELEKQRAISDASEVPALNPGFEPSE